MLKPVLVIALIVGITTLIVKTMQTYNPHVVGMVCPRCRHVSVIESDQFWAQCEKCKCTFACLPAREEGVVLRRERGL